MTPLVLPSQACAVTLVMALVSRPVIFLQMLAARAVEDGGSSLITVFNPDTHKHRTWSQMNCSTYKTLL